MTNLPLNLRNCAASDYGLSMWTSYLRSYDASTLSDEEYRNVHEDIPAIKSSGDMRRCVDKSMR
jgi:hypothetical protein